jgi:pimeloyl-ACP methyl ester carboxylesterase
MRRNRLLDTRLVRSVGYCAAALIIATTPNGPLAAAPQGNGSPPGPPLVLAKQGYLYVGGQYDNPTNPTQMSGQTYVEYQIPVGNPKKVPIVMIHGGGHTGAGFVSTPDGRMGWADFFVREGWPVYVLDRPGVAKSGSFGAFGTATSVFQAELRFSASEKQDPSLTWPQAHLHTQWPGPTGEVGDPSFDQYYAHLAPGGTGGGDPATVSALIALLEKIGPAILMEHSAGSSPTWMTADARPDLVRGIIMVEPNGPPFREAARFGMPGGQLTRPWGLSSGPLTYDPPVSDPSQLVQVLESAPDAPDLIPCWEQGEPARQLPRLAQVRILEILSQASYHAPYDHCTSKYLTDAGVPHDFVKLVDLGILGNGHIMFDEKNNLDIARVIENWLVTSGAGIDKNRKG